MQTDMTIQNEKNIYQRMYREVPEYNNFSPAVEIISGIIDVAKFRKVETVLDAGCGKGQAVFILDKAGFDVTGVDITLDGLNVECARNRFYECPISGMPYGDNQFDMVICIDVLEHLPPNILEASVKEISRVCKDFSLLQVYLNKDGYGKFIGETLHKSILTKERWTALFDKYYQRVQLLEHHGSRLLFYCEA